MKYILITIAILSSFFANAQSPSLDWVKQMGDSTGDIFINSSATDASGNLYTTGLFDGTVDFDPGTAIYNLTDSGFGDIFISKTDPSGNFLWVKQIGGSSYDEGRSIAIDPQGNIVVTGFFSQDSTDFDPGPATCYLRGGGAKTFFLKLDAAGNFIWANELQGFNENSPASLAIDVSGNLLITGVFDGSADFDPGTGTHVLTCACSHDIFIMKLNSSGDFIWARQIETACTNTGSFSVANDASNNVYVTGLLLGTVDFDPGTGVSDLSNPAASIGGSEFILKLDSSGNFSWAKAIGGDIDQSRSDRAIRVDPQGNSFTTGWFTNTVDFDPNAGVSNLSNTLTTGGSIYILKLNSAGDLVCAKQIGDPDNGNQKAITLDQFNNLYITGRLSSTGDFDPGAGTLTLTAANGNSYVAKYDSLGNLIWAVNFSNNNSTSDHNSTINVDLIGNVYTTGDFSGVADFDPGASVVTLTAGSVQNIFIHKMNQHSSLFVKDFPNDQNNISVYPNPNNGNFSLEAKMSGVYSIVNEAGQVIESILAKAGSNNIINITRLPCGTYFVVDNDKTTGHKNNIQQFVISK